MIGLLGFPCAAKAETLTANCDTPTDRDTCNRWYTESTVTLSWEHQPGGGTGSGCGGGVFQKEMTRTEIECTWHWSAATVIKKIWIGIDGTGPTVTGPGLGRPPDNGEWFNHPVAFGFTGQDATSGIADCTAGTYDGPDGVGVSVTGSCRDVAGNVTSRTFAINYDATPPPDPNARVLPGNHRVRLTWDSSQYLAEVVRLSRASAQAVLFRGTTGRFTDRRLRNGRRYRYRVTLIDQAGNMAADVTTAVPTSSKLLLPADGAHLTAAPELVWKSVKRASYYNAQLLHRGRKVLTRWPVTNRLQLRERWRSLGRRHHLARGRYCWYVWPGFGPRHERNYGRLLGSSCFRVTG
jgi:hypothetical protein